jgi:hypothetical protein
LIIHGIPSQPKDSPDMIKEGNSIMELINELGPGLKVKKTDIAKSNRQVLHWNKQFLPITVIFKEKETVDKITKAAKEAGFWNKRAPKEGPTEDDPPRGWFRASKTKMEREQLRARREFAETEEGKTRN